MFIFLYFWHFWIEVNQVVPVLRPVYMQSGYHLLILMYDCT